MLKKDTSNAHLHVLRVERMGRWEPERLIDDVLEPLLRGRGERVPTDPGSLAHEDEAEEKEAHGDRGSSREPSGH